VRDQLDAALSKGGFDADRDIETITVDRWPHGYSYGPDLLWEPDWPNEDSKPWVIGRRPFGRTAIANSDAGASADTNSAITHGHRAVQEILQPRRSIELPHALASTRFLSPRSCAVSMK
jgi:spermidine dehydrogenase